MRIEVRILDDRLPGWGFPHWGSASAAGLDLFACLDEPLVLAPGDPAALVPAGLSLHIADPDWCGLVAPRSGLGHRGIVLGNAVGVIDADYTGQVLVSAWNRNAPAGRGRAGEGRAGEGRAGEGLITIAPGDRIAQMLFVRVERPAFAVVEAFSAPSARGPGGFGSTGSGRRS